MDSRQECPEVNTDYELIVRWLDGTVTTRGIEIEVEVAGGGDGTSSSGGAGALVPVTPIPIPGTYVTPVGVLSSVRLLPETGELPSPHVTEAPRPMSILELWSGAGLILGLILLAGLRRR